MITPRSAYVHIPFCKHHCGYCDFAVVAGRDHQQAIYLEALELELDSLKQPAVLDTLFIGGGTPTYLAHTELARLMAMLNRWLPLAAGAEFSIEATPESLDTAKVAVLKAGGVNRISLGIQTFHDHLLERLERVHRQADIAPAVRLGMEAIGNVSLDLIFAVPGQSLQEWRDDLKRAIDLGVPHVSTYGLTFEKGTPLWKKRERKEIVSLEEELERSMYEASMDLLNAAGYGQYEISNFAKPGFECRHNQVYWANDPHFAFGLGSARYVGGRRENNTRSLDTYARKLFAGESPTQKGETLEPVERAKETIFTQLRRREGIDRAEFHLRTGFVLDDLAGERMVRLVTQGYLGDDGKGIRLTREGKCVADAVITELMAG